MSDTGMTYEEIKAEIKALSLSQGFYGRLLRELDYLESENPEQFEDIKGQLESAHLKDVVDMILFLEG